jgi:membrane glycosyltransferase
VALGRRLRRARLFLIPEESRPPRVLRRMRRHLCGTEVYPDFIAAVVDPLANAIACATESARTHQSEAVRATHAALVERAISGGPEALGAADRVALLGDAHALARMHGAVWTRADAHAAWQAECWRTPAAASGAATEQGTAPAAADGLRVAEIGTVALAQPPATAVQVRVE